MCTPMPAKCAGDLQYAQKKGYRSDRHPNFPSDDRFNLDTIGRTWLFVPDDSFTYSIKNNT
jgi:hypothetical protein